MGLLKRSTATTNRGFLSSPSSLLSRLSREHVNLFHVGQPLFPHARRFATRTMGNCTLFEAVAPVRWGGRREGAAPNHLARKLAKLIWLTLAFSRGLLDSGRKWLAR